MITGNITLSDNDKIAFISNMSTMLSAGIPILDVVESLLDDAKGNQKKILQVLKADLGQGRHVSYSFGRFPKVFDKVTVNVIKASEEAGTLDEALKDLKNTIRKDMEFNDSIKSALTYPFFILIVFCVVMGVILVFVMPRITQVFTSLHAHLPLPTQILIDLSNLILTYTIPIIVGTIVAISSLIFFYRTNKRYIVSAFVSLPGISGLARDIDLVRFTRSLHLLLTAGIPITSALELTQDVVTKREIRRIVLHTKSLVYEGKRFSQGLRDGKKEIPSIMIKIVEAGEISGSLDRSLTDVAEYLDYEVSRKIKTLTALIEPIMLVGVGFLVGGMMVSIIAPIYNLIANISPTS
jgi:type II secretory pathway component PulF